MPLSAAILAAIRGVMSTDGASAVNVYAGSILHGIPAITEHSGDLSPEHSGDLSPKCCVILSFTKNQRVVLNPLYGAGGKNALALVDGLGAQIVFVFDDNNKSFLILLGTSEEVQEVLRRIVDRFMSIYMMDHGAAQRSESSAKAARRYAAHIRREMPVPLDPENQNEWLTKFILQHSSFLGEVEEQYS
jgi:hypothetical protein